MRKVAPFPAVAEEDVWALNKQQEFNKKLGRAFGDETCVALGRSFQNATG
jgi:hypothetical protein